MVVDAVRAYFDAVSGLTEPTRKRAVAAAKVILRAGEERSAAPANADAPVAPAAEPGDAASRAGSPIQALAGELIETGQVNRQALNALISGEVARALERADVVSRADYDRLARRVAELERRLAAQRAPSAPAHPEPVHPVARQAGLESGVQPPPTDGARTPAGSTASDAADESTAPHAGPEPEPETGTEPEAGPKTENGPSQDTDGGTTESPARGETPEEGTVADGTETADSADGATAGAAAQPPSTGPSNRASGAGGGGQVAKKKSVPAKGQQRSTKTKSTSGRSAQTAKSGSAKSSGSRGKNSTKNDQ